jgi:hypothetical protein
MVSCRERVWRVSQARVGRLAVVLPVLVEQRGHAGQPGHGRTGQCRNPEAIHTLTLPAHPPASPSSRRCAFVNSNSYPRFGRRDRILAVRIAQLFHSSGMKAAG